MAKTLKEQIQEMSEDEVRGELYKCITDAATINAENIRLLSENKGLMEQLVKQRKEIEEAKKEPRIVLP